MTETHAEGGRGESDHGNAKDAAGAETFDGNDPRHVEENVEGEKQS